MQICEICLNNFKTLQCMTESCQQNRFELAIGLKQVKRLAYNKIQLEKAMDNLDFITLRPEIEESTRLEETLCSICFKKFKQPIKDRMQMTCSGRCGDIQRTITCKEKVI